MTSCTEQPGATVSRKPLLKKSGRRDPTAPSWHGYLGQSALVRFIHDLLPGSRRTPRLQLSSVCIHTEHSNSPKTVKEKAFFQCVERFKMWKWPSVKYSNLWKVDITIPYNPGMAQQGHGNGFSDSSFFTALIQHDLNNSFLSAFAVSAQPVLLHCQILLNSHSTI